MSRDYKSTEVIGIHPEWRASRSLAGVYGSYLRHRRVTHQLTQGRVAEMIGVERVRVSEVERGHRKTVWICLALDVLYDELDQGTAPSVARRRATTKAIRSAR